MESTASEQPLPATVVAARLGCGHVYVRWDPELRDLTRLRCFSPGSDVCGMPLSAPRECQPPTCLLALSVTVWPRVCAAASRPRPEPRLLPALVGHSIGPAAAALAAPEAADGISFLAYRSPQ
jgi:hypothetical protein